MAMRTLVLLGCLGFLATAVLWRSLDRESAEPVTTEPTRESASAKPPGIATLTALNGGRTNEEMGASARRQENVSLPQNEAGRAHLPARGKLESTLARPDSRPAELLAVLVAAIAEYEVARGEGIPWASGEPIQPLMHQTNSSLLALHSHAGKIHAVMVEESRYPVVFALIRARDADPLLGPLFAGSEHHRGAASVLAQIDQL